MIIYIKSKQRAHFFLMLGTPWLFQHGVSIGFNLAQVTVRSPISLPLKGDQLFTLESRSSELQRDRIDDYRRELVNYATEICKEAKDTPLPPFRVINHTIPLIEENKRYAWCLAKCPEALKPLWREKRDDYLATGRWQFQSGTNAVPMLMLKKPAKDNVLRLRTVCDTRERNINSRRLSSLLPDIEAILRNVVSHKFWSLLDGKDAYEQIHIIKEHIHRSLFATPDGTMVSLVMQIGDCNASATYQSIMNHIFSDLIGVILDVYLDDIVVYSDSPEDHVKHVRLVIDRLQDNKFFLSAHKLFFFKEELNLLGHVIDSQGIHMDPAKVDQVSSWKTPSNKGLLASFIGPWSTLHPAA